MFQGLAGRGEFADEAGLLPLGARLRIRIALREVMPHAPTWSEGGRFVFDLLRPGRYRVAIEHAEQLLFATWVELAPGAEVDLGRIAGAPPGSLVLALDPHPPAAVGGRVLDGSHGEVAALDLVDGRLGVAALPPGEWFLDLEASGMGRVCAPFAIRAGERTELALALVPGMERSLSFELEGRAWDTLRVELRDARGNLVFAKYIVRRYWPAVGAGPDLLVCLPVGTFTLEAETDTGLRLRTSFDVPALVPQESALEFELR